MDESSRPTAVAHARSTRPRSLISIAIWTYSAPNVRKNFSNLCSNTNCSRHLNSRMLSAFVHLALSAKCRVLESGGRPNLALAEIPPKDPTRVIAIGNILDRGEDTGNLYYIDVDALQKHTIVCGVTGGGKNNTRVFICLGQLCAIHLAYPSWVWRTG